MCCGVGKLLSSRDAPQELLGSGAHGNPKSRAQELSERPTSPPNQVASARALGSFCPRPNSSSTRELMGRNTCMAASLIGRFLQVTLIIDAFYSYYYLGLDLVARSRDDYTYLLPRVSCGIRKSCGFGPHGDRCSAPSGADGLCAHLPRRAPAAPHELSGKVRVGGWVHAPAARRSAWAR